MFLTLAARGLRFFSRAALCLLGVLFLGCGHPAKSNVPTALFGIALTNQDGRPVETASLHGNAWLLNFMFTSCPGVCPRQTRALVSVRQDLPKSVRERIRFLSVSVDPENDGAAELKRFANAHGANLDGWSFARANKQETLLLASRLAAFEKQDSKLPAPSLHTTALFLFDDRGRLMQRYDGTPVDVSRVAREIVSLDEMIRSEARFASR
jgi:protein SCO1